MRPASCSRNGISQSFRTLQVGFRTLRQSRGCMKMIEDVIRQASIQDARVQPVHSLTHRACSLPGKHSMRSSQPTAGSKQEVLVKLLQVLPRRNNLPGAQACRTTPLQNSFRSLAPKGLRGLSTSPRSHHGPPSCLRRTPKRLPQCDKA